MSQCNFCNLKEPKREARKNRQKVTLRPGWNGGLDVYVHPKNVVIPKIDGDKNPLRKKYCHQWFQALTDRCVC